MMSKTGKLSILGAVLAAAVTGAFHARAADSFVFATFGGLEAEKVAWTEPYTQKTGVSITVDQPIDFAKIKAQVEAQNVYWDVVHVDGYFGAAQCGKLFEPLTAAVDRSKLDERLDLNPCGIPIVVNAAVLVYSKNEFTGDKPQSWADFFDTTKFPGQRAMINFPVNGALEAALLADGVPADKLYPLDLDRAFKKLDTIKSDIVFTQSSTQLSELLVSEAVPMAIAFNGRAYMAVKEGAPYEAVWNQSILQTDTLAVVKGSKNRDAAEAFLSYVAQPEQQARLVEFVPYGAATKDTKLNVDPLLSSYLPNSGDNAKSSVVLDAKWVGDNFDEINRRWTEWTSK